MDQALKVEPTTGKVSVETILIPETNYLNPVRNYLGVEGTDAKATQQLDYIYNQIKGDKDLNDGDILMALKEIKMRVGYPRLGETTTSKVYNYLRAMEDVKTAEKRRDALLA